MTHNQVPYDLAADNEPESPMMRGNVSPHSHMRLLESFAEDNILSLIPKKYRQVEMKYSKLGEVYMV